MSLPVAPESCQRCDHPGPAAWSELFGCYACPDCHPDSSMLARVQAAVHKAEEEARQGSNNSDRCEDAADGVGFEVATAAELCALPDPPTSDRLVGELLTRGARLVLGGHTGEGKTTLALQMVRAVALGESFLEWQAAEGRVLVVDAEQGLKTIKRRLREAGLSESERVDYLRVPDGLALDSDEDEAAGVEALLEAGGYALVVADPLYKLHRGDSNSEREAVDLMRRFDRWRERYGFALLLPAHCRKPQPGGGRFTMHEFFGQSAYLRGAEVVLGLQRLSDGYSRLHFFKDRDGDLPMGESWGLLFDREQGFRRDPHDDEPKQTAAEKIRELLTDNSDQTIEQLVRGSGYAERTVKDALKKIGATGKRAGAADTPKQWELPLEEDDS